MNYSQKTAIQTTETISGVLSAIGCLIVLSKFVGKKKASKNLGNSHVVVLSSIDLVGSIFFSIGLAGSRSAGFCNFQGLMIQWFGLANIAWNCFMAYQLHKWIVRKKNEDKLVKNIKKASLATLSSTLLLSLVLLAAGVYEKSGLWCWIGSGKNEWLRFAFFYLLLVIAWVFAAYMFNEVSHSIRSRSNQSGETGLNFADEIIQSKLREYLLVFLISWGFGLLNRFVEIIIGEPCFPTTILHAAFVPFQGFMNAVCYGGLLNEDSPLILWLSNSWIVKNFPTLAVIEDAKRRKSIVRANTVFGAPEYKSKLVSIFATTFNMGEAPVSDVGDISKWLLEGHDIYSIGLQECLCLEEMRSEMHRSLGTDKFSMHTCEIGSNNTRLGFHGFIALTVFVRTSLIDDGSVRMTESSSNELESGANLIVTTAANKGAVGLPFQIHDVSIGFITAHLPSDSKGKSKLPKRNENARSMLKEVALASEDVGCDLQLQHDHVVVMGDLNYRMNTPAILDATGRESVGEGASALQGIAAAAAMEMKALGDDPYWFRRKYSLMYGPRSPLYPPTEERNKLLSAERYAQEAWNNVLQYDEMRYMMDLGEVFYGFDEPPPRFPPSYKRKKGGIDGDCGDYSTFSDLVQGYSHTGEESNSSAPTFSGGLHMMDESTSSTMTGISEDSNVDTSNRGVSIDDDMESRFSEVSDRSSTASISSTASKIFGEVGENGTSVVREKKSKRRSSVFGSMRNPEKEKEKERLKLQSKLRPPSYTDRILTHSLVSNRLKSNAYGFCDSIRCSDHRPVCMSLTLEVNANVLLPKVTSFNDTKSSQHPHSFGPSTLFLSLKIRNLSVDISSSENTLNPLLRGATLSSSGAGQSFPMNVSKSVLEAFEESDDVDVESREPVKTEPVHQRDSLARIASSRNIVAESLSTATTIKDIHDVTVIFPLPSKDPLLEYRKMYAVAQAFSSGSSAGILKSFQKRNAKLKASLLKSKSDFPWEYCRSNDIEVEGCGNISLGLEVLIKLSDEDNEDLGECLVNLIDIVKNEQFEQPQFMRVPLSCGGKYKGTLEADFILRPLKENAAFS